MSARNQRNVVRGKTRMTPSEAFVETLVANDVTDMFGIMGSASMYSGVHDMPQRRCPDQWQAIIAAWIMRRLRASDQDRNSRIATQVPDQVPRYPRLGSSTCSLPQPRLRYISKMTVFHKNPRSFSELRLRLLISGSLVRAQQAEPITPENTR